MLIHRADVCKLDKAMSDNQGWEVVGRKDYLSLSCNSSSCKSRKQMNSSGGRKLSPQ